MTSFKFYLSIHFGRWSFSYILSVYKSEISTWEHIYKVINNSQIQLFFQVGSSMELPFTDFQTKYTRDLMIHQQNNEKLSKYFVHHHMFPLLPVYPGLGL